MEVGLRVIYSPENVAAQADIVFVHGLNGHPRHTWAVKLPPEGPTISNRRKLWQRLAPRTPSNQGQHGSRSNDGCEVFWPKDLLPHDCPKCRILTFGYDSLVTKFFAGPANQDSIHGHSKNLLYALARTRVDCQGRPVLFVAHSLGGVLVKEVIRRAAVDEDTELLDVRNSTKAILFLGTPHRGSSMAQWGETMRRIVAISGFDSNDRNIRALYYDSTDLEVSREEFVRQWRQGNFVVRTFQESQGYKGVNGINGKVVADMSSSLDDPREHAEHINANHVGMCRFTGRDDPGYQQVGGELRKIINQIRREKDDAAENMSTTQTSFPPEGGDLSSEEQECLRSLYVPEIDIWEYGLSPDVQNTRLWLFDTPQYCAWEDMTTSGLEHTLLWVKGKPGAGKSTLLKVAVARLRSDKARSESVKLAFSFNANGNTFEKTRLGLFRSLLFQLCQQSKKIFRRFLLLFRRKVDFYDEEWIWKEAELESFLMSVTNEDSPLSGYIFIDALNECDDAREVTKFFDLFRATRLRNNGNIRICYSSRYYPHIQVGDHVELHTDTMNSCDIEEYIERKLGPMLKRRHITKLRDYIIEKAQGVFLWAALIVGRIIEANDNGDSMKELWQMVEDVPDQLGGLYRKSLEIVRPEIVADTRLLLQWVLCATKPLTLLELRYALAFQNVGKGSQAEVEDSLSFIDSDQQMDLFHKSRTGGLTESRTQTTVQSDSYARKVLDGNGQSTIQFIHGSIRNFLLKHGGLELIGSGSALEILQQGEYQLAETCINYLDTAELRLVVEMHQEPDSMGLTRSVELLRKLCRKYPLLLYSLHSVFKHIKAAESYQTEGTSHSEYLYRRMESVFHVWRYLSDLESKSRLYEIHGAATSLAHLAAEQGMLQWVKVYLADGKDINVVGGRFGTLLVAATVMGHTDIVNVLLDSGADVHIGEGRFGAAISAAAWLGNLTIVKTLIRRGCSVNDYSGDYSSPLQAAASSQNGSVELIHTLLTAGANIHMSGGRHGTAVQAGAYRGDSDIVRALLERGADINAQSGEHGAALAAAAFQGHEETVRMLLEYGADPTIEGGDYGNAIWAAAYQKQELIVRQITRRLRSGWHQDRVEVEVQEVLSNASRAKRFHEAVARGDLDSVKNWINLGIDPNARGGDFSSALHTAALYGHADIVALLLTHQQVKVDMRDSRGRTPLWHAASNGHVVITRMLLDTRKVDRQCKTSHSGRNLLWFPSKNGDLEIVRMVWEAGADPREPDHDGITPLMAAEEEEQAAVVLLFNENTRGRVEA